MYCISLLLSTYWHYLTENWETLVRKVKPEAYFWHTVR